MSPNEFIHPEDAAALRQMESIPGFPLFVKKVLSWGFENLRYGINMASCIRLSEKQLPEIYKHLPPICEKLAIPEPEFYLTMDPVPNACTFGDTRIFITVTSGLLELLNDDELDAVIAHECGHILCRHVLYHSVAQMIMEGTKSSELLSALTIPVQLALLYWQRKSELSCDRAAAVITSPEVVSRSMARLSGGPKSLTNHLNMAEWALQADQYESIKNESTWNKALQISAIATQDHPFSAVRVREILKWGLSEDYLRLKEALKNNGSSKVCPSCHKPVEDDWAFCKYCGHKLK